MALVLSNFRKFWFWFLILFIGQNIAAQKINVLLISMDQSAVQFDQYSNRILRHNKVSIDTAKIQTLRLISSLLSKEFPQINFILAKDLPAFSSMRDSIQELKTWGAFFASENQDKYTEYPKLSYWGRSISASVNNQLKLLMQKSDCSYTLMLNQYEVTTPRPFDRDTKFLMHFELYNKQMLKLSGNFGVYSNRLNRKMYLDVFSFYQRMSILDACSKLKQYWH